MDTDTSEDEVDVLLLGAAAHHLSAVAASLVDEEDTDLPKFDRRRLPRKKRKRHKHAQALACTMRDYLGPEPLFEDKAFDAMFRVSRSGFRRLMEDVGNSGNAFFLAKFDANGRPLASMEARLLLALKTLSYGVAHHTFRDYFQMSVNLARTSCSEFDKVVKRLYQKEHLRLPTPSDLKATEELHFARHKVHGMFG